MIITIPAAELARCYQILNNQVTLETSFTILFQFSFNQEVSMKRINSLRHALLGLSFMIFSLPVFAESSISKAFYVEGNVGGTFIPRSQEAPAGVVIGSAHGVGYNADIGYKFNSYLAIEIGFTNYSYTPVYTTVTDPVDQDLVNPNEIYKVGNMRNFAYNIAGKLILPIYTTGLEFFAKVGAVRLGSTFDRGDLANINDIFGETDEGDEVVFTTPTSHYFTGLYYGAGAEYYIADSWAVNLQVTRSNGNRYTGSFILASAGLSFLFG
jgi:opacity protein-like surface antigen